jgi:RNA polymerase sigma factor (TIGR02999 family)
MGQDPVGEITILLRAWSQGDEHALEKVTPLVYKQLYTAARRYMAGQKPGHLLESTALVNELYLRLVKLEDVDWQDRGYFFALCAQCMRNILTDYARSQLAEKAGGKAQTVVLDENMHIAVDRGPGLLFLDEALTRLAEFDPRASQVVELRFFGGLSAPEIAETLEIGEATVKRDWRFAKHWLLRELRTGHER